MKDSSTTTKLRVVYDASAKTSSGISFNDQLLPGPSLYTMFPSVILNFRYKKIGVSADISKLQGGSVADRGMRLPPVPDQRERSWMSG